MKASTFIILFYAVLLFPAFSQTTRPRLALAAKDVEPGSVRVLGPDKHTNMRPKLVGKSSGELAAMSKRQADITEDGRLIASAGIGLWKSNGTNYGLILVFDTVQEAKAAATALRGGLSK